MRKFQVNYDLSDVHKKPYGIYYLQAVDVKDARYEFVVEDKDTVSFVNDIKLLGNVTTCNCDTLK